jgi:hypothetical protein
MYSKEQIKRHIKKTPLDHCLDLEGVEKIISTPWKHDSLKIYHAYMENIEQTVYSAKSAILYEISGDGRYNIDEEKSVADGFAGVYIEENGEFHSFCKKIVGE